MSMNCWVDSYCGHSGFSNQRDSTEPVNNLNIGDTKLDRFDKN